MGLSILTIMEIAVSFPLDEILITSRVNKTTGKFTGAAYRLHDSEIHKMLFHTESKWNTEKDAEDKVREICTWCVNYERDESLLLLFKEWRYGFIATGIADSELNKFFKTEDCEEPIIIGVINPIVDNKFKVIIAMQSKTGDFILKQSLILTIKEGKAEWINYYPYGTELFLIEQLKGEAKEKSEIIASNVITILHTAGIIKS